MESPTPAAPPKPAIEVESLSHEFNGRPALANVGFRVDTGSIHGFVGPNGAGKTTTLKILATLLRPRTGTVRVVGHDVTRDWQDVRRSIGYMPDHFSMYRRMTVFEYLDFFAAAYGLTLDNRNKVVDDVMVLTDIGARRDDLIQSLSRGMMQRVALARVLVNDPRLLLLDEPASGLDPRARVELMEILRELRRMGKTIFISSHILSELADLCDAVTIIDGGTIKYSGSMDDLLRHSGDHVVYVLRLASETSALEPAIAILPGVSSVRRVDGATEYLISVDRCVLDRGVVDRSASSGSAILRAALAAGGDVVSFQEDRRHLNQVFMDLTDPGPSPAG